MNTPYHDSSTPKFLLHTFACIDPGCSSRFLEAGSGGDLAFLRFASRTSEVSHQLLNAVFTFIFTFIILLAVLPLLTTYQSTFAMNY